MLLVISSYLKLTKVVNEDDSVRSKNTADLINAENLALVQLCIDCTLSQLLDTGTFSDLYCRTCGSAFALRIHASPRLFQAYSIQIHMVSGIFWFCLWPLACILS